MTILNAEPNLYSRQARKILESLGKVVEEAVSQEELAQKLKGIDVLIVRVGLTVSKDVLQAADNLRFIVSATTGIDHIDVDIAESLGIKVLSLKGENQFLDSIPSTSEHTWALLLSLVRKVPWAYDHIRENGWDRDMFKGNNIAGKNLGIIGLGRVGRQVAIYSKAFKLNTAAFDPYTTSWVDGVKRFEKLEELMEWSHIISIHIPYSKTTEGFIDLEKLLKLPAGAFVINTSRAGVWDEIAVLKLLKNNHLAGVATDVISNERNSTLRIKNPLIEYAKTHNNLLITPHIAGATHESMHLTEVFMANKLLRFVNNDLKR